MKKTAMTAAGMMIAISILAGCGGTLQKKKMRMASKYRKKRKQTKWLRTQKL